MIDQAQYLQQRIDDQINWYDRKSRWNQQWYRRFRVLSIIISLSIPILSGSIGKNHDDLFKLVISIAGASVALIEGLLSLYKFHENWLQYRATAESLKHHRYLFETAAVPYNAANAFSLFVQNTEELMSKERLTWVQNNQSVSGNNNLPEAGRAADAGAVDAGKPQEVTSEPVAGNDAGAGSIVDVPMSADAGNEVDAAMITDAGDKPDAGNEAEEEDEDAQSTAEGAQS